MWMTHFPYQHCFSVTRKQDLSKSFYKWLCLNTYSKPPSQVPCQADLPSLATIHKQASSHGRLLNFSTLLCCLSPASAFSHVVPFTSHPLCPPSHLSNVLWAFFITTGFRPSSVNGQKKTMLIASDR